VSFCGWCDGVCVAGNVYGPYDINGILLCSAWVYNPSSCPYTDSISKISGSQVVAIVIPIMAIFTIFGVVIFYFRRRRNSNQSVLPQVTAPPQSSPNVQYPISVASSSSTSDPPPNYQQYQQQLQTTNAGPKDRASTGRPSISLSQTTSPMLVNQNPELAAIQMSGFEPMQMNQYPDGNTTDALGADSVDISLNGDEPPKYQP